ncbi:MAG: hypothetical protein COB67_13675 [SAR324 cluster bacterium]|uniref:Tll0287-like domain-containing protein n=1 Tax=SAR324 cluster bacterium TaxID=2024889 RepID=A0A2A4SLP6_9DELT|nr:MAG: hypothetical protein COB67_13675 [SAR324 cluster bacterium]
MRKRIGLALLLGSFLVMGQGQAKDLQSQTQESRKIIKGFGGNLKKTLVKAMKAGGPVAAIEACNLQAMPMTQEVALKNNMKVGRTSLKIRNYQNNPDVWEREILHSFEQRQANGENPKKIDHAEIVTENGKQYFRYMKAIPTGKPCLSCHGDNLKPALSNKLTEKYPYDQALGYKLGEIRGAFTLIRAL